MARILTTDRLMLPAVMAGLAMLSEIGLPILVGVSRKRFIGLLDKRGDGEPGPRARLGGSLAAAVSAASHGASILRVHDVSATRQALTVWNAIEKAKSRP